MSEGEQARDERGTLTGVLCGMGAGALWGLVFLAPELAHGFSPLELAVGRYLAYGLAAAALIARNWHGITARMSTREWRALCWLSMTGNIVYYVLLASAVRLGGIAMTSLVIGFLPVAVTIIGSRDQGAVRLQALAPSLLLGAAGAACIGGQAWIATGVETAGMQIIGLSCAVGALLSWTAFAVGNSRWLARLDHISAHDWNLLIGLMTGVQALLLLPVALLWRAPHHEAIDWARFAGVSIGVALLASILGNALWNRMSRLLPLTLTGQMILFETAFALLYGFAWERRAPTALEAMAFLLVALSVITCIAAHRPATAKAAPTL